MGIVKDDAWRVRRNWECLMENLRQPEEPIVIIRNLYKNFLRLSQVLYFRRQRLIWIIDLKIEGFMDSCR